MFLKGATSIASFLNLLTPAVAFPAEQLPLHSFSSKSVQAVRSSLKKTKIIPTVIDDVLPSLTLSVHWSDHNAKLGNTIKPKHLQKQPTVTLHDETSSKSDMIYVVTLTDPDAPSRDDPKWSEMCHWIAANITLSPKTFSVLPLPEYGLTSAEKTSDPDDVVEYKPPGPPPKTGKHRYVFLVFAPKNGTTETLHLTKPTERQHWGTGEEGGGVRSWAEENGLVSVGANFVYAENEKQ